METLVLKCNNPLDGYCRKELRQEAFVTSCSHAFCRQCVEKYNFHDPAGGRRECLACSIVLPEDDDVRQSNLRPTEQWKSTILAGLPPAVTNEISGKSYNFWEYQINAQLAWERHVSQQWSKKYSALHKNAGKVIEEANAEISDLQDQLAALKQRQEDSQRQMQNLVKMYNEKKQAHDNVDKMYKTLKAKVQHDDAREAAKVSTEHRTHDAIPRTTQTTMAHRTEPNLHVPDLPLLNKNPHLNQYASGHDHVERLHTHQRSGSATHTSSELAARAMPPPLHTASGRMGTSRTPAQRVSYPVAASSHSYPITAHRAVNDHGRSGHNSVDGNRPSQYYSRQSYTSRSMQQDPNIYARRSTNGVVR